MPPIKYVETEADLYLSPDAPAVPELPVLPDVALVPDEPEVPAVAS
jgi:hypothetical protein